MKNKEKCIKCGSNNWEKKLSGVVICWKCNNCGYIYNILDYISSDLSIRNKRENIKK